MTRLLNLKSSENTPIFFCLILVAYLGHEIFHLVPVAFAPNQFFGRGLQLSALRYLSNKGYTSNAARVVSMTEFPKQTSGVMMITCRPHYALLGKFQEMRHLSRNGRSNENVNNYGIAEPCKYKESRPRILQTMGRK